jgi:cytochrome c peroxidase
MSIRILGLMIVAIAIVEFGSLLLGGTAARSQPATLQAEIAQVESQVDRTEASALAQVAKTTPGSHERVVALGKILFFDKNLSVNRNTACAFCHMPQTGFQGAIEIINKTTVDQPGSVRTRFGLRKPPSAAYAAFSPPLYYRASTEDFVGGNFWDLRATGLRLRNPAASQSQGSPLNPEEMANLEPACVVRRISQSRYRSLFEGVLGPRSFDIAWPSNVDAICSRPNSNPALRIGSEVPGPNQTPYVVRLQQRDRVQVQYTFDAMAQAIAAYEASSEVSPFSSKFDAFLAGKKQLTPSELRGYALFNGKARCNTCHIDPKGDKRPLFTDETTGNLGVPKNPAMAYYGETRPDEYGLVVDPAGKAFVDYAVGAYLRSIENGVRPWKKLAPEFDGRFRVATLRDVDMRPSPGFVKAYMHNGYFKSLKEVVHFYNTRDRLPRCAVGSPGEKVTCWPAPEVAANRDTECCNLGLTNQEEDDLVSFMKTLTDGYHSR